PPSKPSSPTAGPSSSASGPSTASLPKPKPQPTVTRYTVKRGDTLSAIAKRNRTTVAAIQRANGISGAMIHPGQRLVIPRR
ncbi:MAG TPA: LysM peptidoglycan-binding domain-containing protein, partial [Luteolibacter sp.]|nr:LysM peptidoglycan-binding domain-containing protein [Luteolibacter sp.]